MEVVPACLVNASLGSRVTGDTDSFARTLARARVCLRTLTANRQAAQMANATIALDALEPLEIHTDFAAEVAFNHVLTILDGMHDLRELRFGKVLGADRAVDIRAFEDLERVRRADAVNVTQRDIDALIRGNFYSNDTGHV